jgi:hypothetical protein
MTTPPPHPPPPFQSHGVKTQYTGTLQRLCARLLPQARALRIAKQRPIDRLVRQPAWRRRGRTLAAAHTRGAHVLVCLQGCHAPVLSAVLRGGADATQHRRLVDAELVQRDACNRARACLARHRLRVSSQTLVPLTVRPRAHSRQPIRVRVEIMGLIIIILPGISLRFHIFAIP